MCRKQYTHRSGRSHKSFETGTTSVRCHAMECFWGSIAASFLPLGRRRSRSIPATQDREIPGSCDEPPVNNYACDSTIDDDDDEDMQCAIYM